MWTPGEPPQRRRGLCGRAAGRTRAACPEPRVTVGGPRVDRPWPPEEHGALATSASRATFCLCASAFSSHLWFSLHPSGGSQAGRPPPRRCARERGEAGGAPGRPARASLPCGSPHVARCGWLASPWPRGMRLPPGSLRLSRRRRLLRRCGPQEAFAGDAAAWPAPHTWAERRGGLQGLHLAAEAGWRCVGWVGTGTPWPRLCLTRPSKAAFVTGEDGLLGESKRRNWETGPGWAG